jgi:GNAT superfamily N-acetyltransferase
VSAFSLRIATTDDATAAAALYARSGLPGAPTSPAQFELMTQTGHAFLVAESGTAIAGLVRFHDDEGITWFDLLVSTVPGAGRALIHAVIRGAQDRGVRLARSRVPDRWPLPEYFSRAGFLPIGRESDPDSGEPLLVVERRLPLLTVREQRRADASAIGELTGEDPWVFEQGARPGWFVAADGDRVVGVISCRDAGGGLARISEPVLRDEYRGRTLEVWMIERAALYAETNGYHTAELPATPSLDRLRKELEDRLWYLDGDRYVRAFRTPPSQFDDEDWE